MKAEQLSLADYNKIKNVPVVNQDLSVSGFTPVANTYYRHTGTTGTYKQGVIYYYDGTEYKALDGSGGGGGTTLNRYELSISATDLRSNSLLLYKIYTQAKGRVQACTYSYSSSGNFNYTEYTPYMISAAGARFYYISSQQGSLYIYGASTSYGSSKYDYAVINSNKEITGAGQDNWGTTLKIIYYNDTEIT